MVTGLSSAARSRDERRSVWSPRRLLARVFGSGRWASLVLLVGLTIARVLHPSWVDFVQVKYFDLLQSVMPREAPEPVVLVVDIDEASLKTLGQWPWSRGLLAELVRRLHQSGAAIGFDVLFGEPDRLSPTRFATDTPGLPAELAAALARLPSTDQTFADALADAGVVLGQAPLTNPDAPGSTPTRPGMAVVGLGADMDVPTFARLFLTRYPKMSTNLPILETAAGGTGVMVMSGEADSVVRRVPAVVAIGDGIYPTLSIELLRVALGVKNAVMKVNPDLGVVALGLQGKTRLVIPTDPQGRIWPRYAHYSPARYHSAQWVLGPDYDPKVFAGKLVLIGTSAVGLRDLRATPVDASVPGVEVHAQIIESVLAGALLSRPGWAEPAERIATFMVGLILIIALSVVGARWTFALLGLFIGAALGVSVWLYAHDALVLDATGPLITAIVIYGATTYMSFVREEAARRQIKSAFGFYLSPEMVDQLAEHPEQLRLGGETRDMTILFSDVRGFTTISEQFDAAGLAAFMNRYLTPMTGIAQRHGAYIDKYIGDAIMAFWNAPLNQPDHAERACRTVLDMRADLVRLNAELKAEAQANGTKFIPIAIGIGLNSGSCVVGNMGSNQKFNYSVLGDAVNLASRLEGQSKPYHLDNIIGETTRAAAPGFAALEVDLIQVKGKTVPARIFTLLGDETLARTPEFTRLASLHAQALEAYGRQDWSAARAGFAECRTLGAPYGVAGLYDVYDERITGYEAEPPGENWNGVTVATSK